MANRRESLVQGITSTTARPSNINEQVRLTSGGDRCWLTVSLFLLIQNVALRTHLKSLTWCTSGGFVTEEPRTARKKKQAGPLSTIGRVDDRLWAEVEKILEEHDPPAQFGPGRIDQRKALDGVTYRTRGGIQWNQLPREFGDDAGVHRTFQRWVQREVIPRLRALLVKSREELGDVDWQWQSFDLCAGKSPARGDRGGPDLTGRAKNGSKRGVLTEADGGPAAVVVKGADVHDALLLQDALGAVIVDPPDPITGPTHHLCLDKAFDGAPSEATAVVFGHKPHIRRTGEEKPDEKTGRETRPARRWVVERTIGWLNRCRGILIRYEKKAENYLAGVRLACALLWFRRLHRLTT